MHFRLIQKLQKNILTNVTSKYYLKKWENIHGEVLLLMMMQVIK